jgi:hypothetical protein
LREGWGNPLQKIPPGLPSKNLLPGLVLIGTVHADPRGYDRAWRLLTHLQPDLVTVEISRFSLRYRQRQGRRWQRLLARALEGLPAAAVGHLALRRLRAQVDLPFEVRAARDWCRSRGVPWRPLDLGFTARRHLPRYGRELLTPDNLRALVEAEADGSLEDFAAGQYRRARLAYGRTSRRFLTQGEAETRREQFMARRLRVLAGRFRRVAHLGGWEHLVPWEDGGGLWRRLEDLGPLRQLLSEGDWPEPAAPLPRSLGFSGSILNHDRADRVQPPRGRLGTNLAEMWVLS